jgi:uncharacterized protein (DUF58 family)
VLTAEELRQLRRLSLQAGRAVDSPFGGEYRSAFRGQGMEFEEVRPYVPGDDIRHIDWNVTARTGEPHVKQFREERELTLMLVVDLSGSVAFGTGGRDGRTDKRLQIARLAGGLAWAAVRAGDRVGMLSFSDRVEEYLPPRKSRGHAWALIRSVFEHQSAGSGTDLGAALHRVHLSLRRRAVVCVISDFLSAGPFDRPLAVLGRRHRLNALVVHDPVEAALPDVGLIELQDAETGRSRLVDARRLQLVEGVEARVQRLRRAGARATPVRTDEDPFHLLLAHFRGLERLR